MLSLIPEEDLGEKPSFPHSLRIFDLKVRFGKLTLAESR